MPEPLLSIDPVEIRGNTGAALHHQTALKILVDKFVLKDGDFFLDNVKYEYYLIYSVSFNGVSLKIYNIILNFSQISFNFFTLGNII